MSFDVHTTRLHRRALLLASGLIAALPARPGRADEVTAPRPVSLPEDEGVHSDAGFEWWYYTGHFATETGEEFGFQQVFFRVAEGDIRGWAGHCALTDKSALSFRYDQLALLGEGSDHSNGVGMNFGVGEWRIQGSSGRDRLIGSVEGAAWTLLLEATKPPVLHGGDGFSGITVGQGSYYYSYTRQALEGVLERDGRMEAVRGEAWMDHQWGEVFDFTGGGWDWFSVQLDNDVELMAYTLRDASGTVSPATGTWVAPDGAYAEIALGEVTVEATGEWTSPTTGTTYPSSWIIEVPGDQLQIGLTPVLNAQELDTRPTTGVIYWEGAVSVEGTLNGSPAAGRGYVELTGYAPVDPPDLAFG